MNFKLEKTTATPSSLAKLTEIFHLESHAEISAARDANRKFVYYTTADTALRIIDNEGSLWMRNTQCMNDHGEIKYGVELLKNALQSKVGGKLRAALATAEKINPHKATKSYQFFNTLFEDFDEFAYSVVRKTYVACLSEHIEPDENKFGRLSMWRAYGKNNGVAIICKGEPILSRNNWIGAIANRVEYATSEDIGIRLSNLADRIKDNAPWMKQIDTEDFYYYMRGLFASLTICTKHPSFKEELEWRLIFWEGWPSKGALKKETVGVNGVPQNIYKIPLERIPGPEGSEPFDLSLPKILDRILIGPTDFPEVIRHALVQKLRERGFPDPSGAVELTNIPLRQSGNS